MNRPLCVAAFALGLAAVAWVGYGYIGASALALTMTVLIAAVYAAGAWELRRFHLATASLQAALARCASLPAPLAHLAPWLGQVHPSLQNPVRLRVEGERVGLPGPALTPYLVGLLVLLGMLGTFLGMVVTLNGAVLALESTTDLVAIRTALAAPVKGLGLAFGTSVAGVAASAMLGLMSALCRRERLQAAQQLDSAIATVLRGFSLAHQREETLKTLQLQASAMPEVVSHLQALMVQMGSQSQAWMSQMDKQSQALQAQLVASQDRFHQHAQASYTELAAAVDRSLQRSLSDGVRAAGAVVQPVVQATMAGITQESAALRADMAEAAQRQLDGMTAQFGVVARALQTEWVANEEQRLTRFTQQLDAWAVSLLQAAAEAPRAAAEVMGELRAKLSDSLVRDNALLAERGQILATVGTLLDAVHQGAAEQRGAIDALVAQSTALLHDAGTRYGDRVDADAQRMAAVAAQVTGSAMDVASLGTAFGQGVERFSASNEGLVANLQRMEATLKKSMQRSDEQLAYYVAQAREIVDLSILSQKQILEDLQQIARPPAAGLPNEGKASPASLASAATKPGKVAPRAQEVG